MNYKFFDKRVTTSRRIERSRTDDGEDGEGINHRTANILPLSWQEADIRIVHPAIRFPIESFAMMI